MNEKLKKIKLNPVRYFSQQVKGYEDGVDLTTGEGHFNSPFNAKLKAYEALLKNHTKYGYIEGDLTLRKILINQYYPNYNEDKEIIITNGSTHALFSVLLALISSKQDEIVIIAPYYPAYLHIVSLLGAKPIIIDSSQTDFKLTSDSLARVTTENTKAIIINEPNNPTGIVYSEKEKDQLLNYLKDKKYYVVVDEIYREFTNDTYISFSTKIKEDEQLRRNFIFINGLSKSHMMTGYRVGYVVGHENVIHELHKISYLSVSCISSIMQEAAIGALNDDYFPTFVKRYYLNNLLMLTQELDELKIDYVKTTNGYYVFMDIQAFGLSDVEFCELFSNKYHVALVPGMIFGDFFTSFVRISCCRDIKDLITFLKCLSDFVENHQIL